MSKVNFTTPVGRLVMGSLYEPETTNMQGEPLVIKSGANKGQPRVEYYIKLAIPKGAEQHWSQTPWGQLIWKIGHDAFGPVAGTPGFSWKVEDGDDATPNPKAKGKRNCDREGYKGNWIMRFSSGFAPRVYRASTTSPGTWDLYPEVNAVKLGHYVQVSAMCDHNTGQTPGVYLNHDMVAFIAFGEEIVIGKDVSEAGFGAAPLPVGAMATPPATFIPPVAAVTPPPPPPPNPAFLMAPPVRNLTAKAQGASYEQLIGAGWTDELLVAHGMMTL